jgi:hypothetical protein
LIPRTDIVEILDELTFLREQLVRLPTGAYISWVVLEATFAILAAIVALVQ